MFLIWLFVRISRIREHTGTGDSRPTLSSVLRTGSLLLGYWDDPCEEMTGTRVLTMVFMYWPSVTFMDWPCTVDTTQ